MSKIKYKPYQKLLILFFNNKDEKGRAKVTVDEIDSTMADQIHMYRLSMVLYEAFVVIHQKQSVRLFLMNCVM